MRRERFSVSAVWHSQTVSTFQPCSVNAILTYTQPVDEMIKDHQSRIFNMLLVYLLIDQYSEPNGSFSNA